MLLSAEIDECMQRSHSEKTMTTTSSFYVPEAAVMMAIISLCLLHIIHMILTSKQTTK